MKLTSKNFTHNNNLPPKYTCDGDNFAPELTWHDYPKETKSFALTCIDPDSPGKNFIHWMVFNIPIETNGIPEGTVNINGGEGIKNDFGQTEYGGPCPASGEHKYIFTIYALNTEKIDEINKNNFLQKIEPYILDKTEIIGKYKRIG